MYDFSNLSVIELTDIKAHVEALIAAKAQKTTEYITLDYSTYKGTGKAWCAVVDEQTKKIQHFLDCDNNEKSGYKGTKHYYVPLTEGTVYCFNEAGSKSSDRKYYRKVVNGELVAL